MFNKDKMKKITAIRFSRFVKTSLFLLVSFFLCLPVHAQCAMCRAALAGEGNKVKAAAVNDGIVYLMVIPYLLVAAIGYAVYRMRKNKSK
jgi:ABC-type antimicrobial peptide transport system permease subunit